MGTKIKLLALANGDFYQDCKTDKGKHEVLELIKEREFINISCDKHDILINSDYIISIEF